MNAEIAMNGIAAFSIFLFGLLLSIRITPKKIDQAVTAWRKQPRLAATAALAALAGAPAILFNEFQAPRAEFAGSLQASTLEAFSEIASAPGARREIPQSIEARDRAIRNLRDYAGKVEAKKQLINSLTDGPNGSESEKPLPDVETMIERLAARLKADSDDSAGWAMLGWSLLNTGRVAAAVEAYRSAQKYAPEDAAVKLALASAEARLNEIGTTESAETNTPSLSSGTEPVVRAMVDKLAARLENSPDDAEGWVMLMKSRTALGEMDHAKDALRRGLAIFGDDQAVRRRLTAAAQEAGLSTN